MFGIGFGELIIIAVILLMAVGPNRMPTMLKAVVKTYREFRKATRELRASTGIDEILRDEELRALRKPLQVPLTPKKKVTGPAATPATKPLPPTPRSDLSFAERIQEDPPEGVDLAEARAQLDKPSKEEAQKIIDAKLAAAAQDQRIIDAKLAAAEGDTQAQELVAGTAPDPAREAEKQRIIDSKIAAAQAQAKTQLATPAVVPEGEAEAPSAAEER